MASRLLSRVSRRIAPAGCNPIGGAASSPAWSGPIGKLPPVTGFSSSLETQPSQAAPFLRSSQQPFVVNPTLQRFGYSSSASPAMEANQISAQQGSVLKVGGNYEKFSSPLIGSKKFAPYTLLFGWIEEIVLDYVHHEVTRSMVLLYLRLFLIVVMKDVFIGCYDLFSGPPDA